MRKVILVVVALVAIFIVASEEDAEYRHEVMEAIGGHMSAIFKIVSGDVDHSDHLALHVNALADLASIAHELFPEGSEGGEALPTIWETPDDFAAKVTAFQNAASDLKSAVGGSDPTAIGPALRNVGRACKGCHDDYRE